MVFWTNCTHEDSPTTELKLPFDVMCVVIRIICFFLTLWTIWLFVRWVWAFPHRNNRFRRIILYQTLTLARTHRILNILHYFKWYHFMCLNCIVRFCEVLCIRRQPTHCVNLRFCRCFNENVQLLTGISIINTFNFKTLIIWLKISKYRTFHFGHRGFYHAFTKDVNRHIFGSINMPTNYQFAKQYLILIKRLENSRLRFVISIKM